MIYISFQDTKKAATPLAAFEILQSTQCYSDACKYAVFDTIVPSARLNAKYT